MDEFSGEVDIPDYFDAEQLQKPTSETRNKFTEVVERLRNLETNYMRVRNVHVEEIFSPDKKVELNEFTERLRIMNDTTLSPEEQEQQMQEVDQGIEERKTYQEDSITLVIHSDINRRIEEDESGRPLRKQESHVNANARMLRRNLQNGSTKVTSFDRYNTSDPKIKRHELTTEEIRDILENISDQDEDAESKKKFIWMLHVLNAVSHLQTDASVQSIYHIAKDFFPDELPPSAPLRNDEFPHAIELLLDGSPYPVSEIREQTTFVEFGDGTKVKVEWTKNTEDDSVAEGSPYPTLVINLTHPQKGRYLYRYYGQNMNEELIIGEGKSKWNEEERAEGVGHPTEATLKEFTNLLIATMKSGEKTHLYGDIDEN